MEYVIGKMHSAAWSSDGSITGCYTDAVDENGELTKTRLWRLTPDHEDWAEAVTLANNPRQDDE